MKKLYLFILTLWFFGVKSVEAVVPVFPTEREKINRYDSEKHIAIEGYYTFANYFMVTHSSDTSVKTERKYEIFMLNRYGFWTGDTIKEHQANINPQFFGRDNSRILFTLKERNSDEKLVVFDWFDIDLSKNEVVSHESKDEGWLTNEYRYSISLDKIRERFFEGKKDSLEWEKKLVAQLHGHPEDPKFPGGDEACFEFIRNNLVYPTEARDSNIQGTVFVQFVIERDGSIADVRVIRGIGGGCDEEAVRIVQSMPNWKPGRKRGEIVRVQFMMPIRFFITN